jgi:hypothetical protein
VAATWFAVAGVILGLSITASGDGPAKAPNVAYHVCLLAVLVTGLIALLCDTPHPRQLPRDTAAAGPRPAPPGRPWRGA